MTSADWVDDFRSFTVDTTDPHRPATSNKQTAPADTEPQPSDTSARSSTLGPDDPLLESPNRLLRVEEAAEYLAMSRAKVYELMAAGEIESILIGGSRRIPLAALDDFVNRLRADGGCHSPRAS